MKQSIRRADAKNLMLQDMPTELNETVPDLSIETQNELTNDEMELIESFLEV